MPTLKLRKIYLIYPEYRNSGIEWATALPKTWEIASMRRLFSTRKIPIGNKADKYKILSLTLKGIIPRVLDGSGKNPTDYTTYQEFKKNDLVFCLFDYDVTPRTIGYVGEDGMMTGAYTRLIPKQEVCSKFYYYYFLSLDYTKELLHLCTGLRSSVPKPLFWAMKNPLPSLDVQNKIVDLLNKKTDLIDQTIEKKKKLIELLHEKRTAIINQAVTKGLDPKAELVDSGVEWIGKIPAGWRVMPFKIGVRFQEGPGIMAPDFMEDGVPLLRVRNLKAGFVSLKNCNFLDQKKVDATWKHFLLKNGDLLISASATMGIVSEVDSRSEGSIAYTGIIRLIPIGGISVKDYIKFFVISKVYNTQIDVLHAGTAMQHYGPSHLKKIFCILPPTILQIEIAKYLNLVTKDIDQLIKITDDSVKLLQEFKMSLISNAVTGKIKI